MTHTETTVTEEEMRERLLDFAAYVLTSARALYREPQTYGPMRMIDTLDKALKLLEAAGVKDAAIEQSMAVIRENRWRVTAEPAAFTETLDEAILGLVKVT